MMEVNRMSAVDQSTHDGVWAQGRHSSGWGRGSLARALSPARRVNAGETLGLWSKEACALRSPRPAADFTRSVSPLRSCPSVGLESETTAADNNVGRGQAS